MTDKKPSLKDLDRLRCELVEWIQAYDALMETYQALIHEHEELKREVGCRYRNRFKTQCYLVGGNKKT